MSLILAILLMRQAMGIATLSEGVEKGVGVYSLLSEPTFDA